MQTQQKQNIKKPSGGKNSFTPSDVQIPDIDNILDEITKASKTADLLEAVVELNHRERDTCSCY